MDTIKDEILQLLEKPLADEECYIVDFKLSKYKNNNTLRFFIYGKDRTSLDECTRISRLIGDIIDGTDLFKKGYVLEVSSPGLDRPLTSKRDFEYRKGETVSVSFFEKGKKKITAKIIGTNENLIEFENNDGLFSLDLAEIESAKIVF